MKKFIFAAFIAAVALVSCSKEANKTCYKVNYTTPAQEAIKDSTGTVIREAIKATEFTIYKWATATEIEAYRKNWQSMGYTNITTEEIKKTDTKDIKTMADCLSIK